MSRQKKESKGQEKRRGTVWSAGRILIPVLFVVRAMAIGVGAGIWNEYRDAVIDTQKRQMLLTVQSLSENMEVFFEGCAEDLEGLYKMGEKRPVWELESILQKYADSHSVFVQDVIMEDEQGEIIAGTRRLPAWQICAVSHMDKRRSLQLAKTDNGKMCLILRQEIPQKGAISISVNLETYYQKLILGLQVGTNGYIVLKDAEGRIWLHPERAQWGIEVIGGRMEMYPNLDLESLVGLIEHQKQGRAGVEEYYSYWWVEEGYPRVRKISAYCPVQIGEDFLILSAVMDYDDIYIPVAKGVFRLVMLFLVFFLVMVMMALYIVRMMLQKQKDTEQIAYLTELNRLLEEMHRSEETIAHQQRLQIMGTMTGGIAHEFNNLLTPIMGYADLLMLELPQDSEQYDSAAEIYEASAKAKEIIQQISSLSRKNMETAYKNMSVKKMLIRALKMVRSVCPSNVTLKEKICLDDEYILCNETQMNQVILNICVNAIHAIDHRNGEIVAEAALADQRKLDKLNGSGRYQMTASENWSQYVCVEIRDNGCGMSREVMSQIFDPFFTTKKGGKGTGLGLALAEQIIHSHKGCLNVESEPGQGSSFFIYLPVYEAGMKGPMESKKYRKGRRCLRLLVVDDNPKVLKLLERDGARLPSAEKPGKTTSTVEEEISLDCRMSFEDARRALEGQEDQGMEDKGLNAGDDPHGRFDALAAEQEIGGRSAIDFCMSVQGKYPDMIMIVMADQVTRELVEAKQRGIIDGYIDKPVSISSILKAIKERSE